MASLRPDVYRTVSSGFARCLVQHGRYECTVGYECMQRF